jgi:hypothetical protein
MKKLLAAALLLTAAAPLTAKTIVIEPDDFIGQGPITSPYALIANRQSTGVYTPVYATTDTNGAPAPTGQAIFDALSTAAQGEPGEWWGFSIRFLVPVTQFQIGAVNTLIPWGHDLEAWCFSAAEVRSGCGVDHHSGDGTYGVPYFTRVWSRGGAPIYEVLIGGEDSIGGMRFDRISFEVPDDVEVPEPAPLASFASALAVLAFLRRRKGQART